MSSYLLLLSIYLMILTRIRFSVKVKKQSVILISYVDYVKILT